MIEMLKMKLLTHTMQWKQTRRNRMIIAKLKNKQADKIASILWSEWTDAKDAGEEKQAKELEDILKRLGEFIPN